MISLRWEDGTALEYLDEYEDRLKMGTYEGSGLSFLFWSSEVTKYGNIDGLLGGILLVLEDGNTLVSSDEAADEINKLGLLKELRWAI